MFEVEINGKKVNAEVTFYTAVLYEEEFRKDIIQDFFGVQDSSEALIVETEDGDEPKVSIDFTKVNWASSMKVLWAAVKTANDRTPGYVAWMKKAKGINLWVLREAIGIEMADCFFRAGAAEEDGQEQ